MKIGFVGLGAMGSAMAGRLLEAGHTLSVYNRTRERTEPLVRSGARAASSPAEASHDVDLVFSMLTDDRAVEDVAFGPDGILDGLERDAVHLSSSTISVALSRRLQHTHAERSQRFLSATVLGRPPAAQAGKLFVLLAGSTEAAEKAAPALDDVSQRVFSVGNDPAAGNLVKLVLNFLIFSTIEQMSEVFAIGEKGGVPPAFLFEVFTNSLFDAPVHKNYGRLILDGKFDAPGASVHLAAKDTRLLLEAGDALGAPMPMASLLRDRLLPLVARGDGDLDFAVLSRRAREEAGLPTG